MNTTLFINPIITPAIIALAISAGVLALIVMNAATIIAKLEEARKKILTRSGFFWAVNLVFMAVSVLHAGAFFGITGNGVTLNVKGKSIPVAAAGHDLLGMAHLLGFAVSFFLDLVTIILMQAMLESRYRGEDGRAKQFLFFITVCCGTSTFANMAISLNDFDPSMLPHAPLWVQIAAPYVLASFPLFVIMMSIAAEMIVNIRPLDKLKEEEYEGDEKKRVKMLEIRNTYLEKQANEELRALTIRAQMKANKLLRRGKTPGGFRWFWEKSVDVDTIIAGVTSQLKALYEPEIESLKKRLAEMNTTANTSDSLPAFHRNDSTYNRVAASSSQTSIRVEINDDDQEVNPSSINGIPTTLDVASLNLSPAATEVVQRYPNVYFQWLSKSIKTASIDDIAAVTGQPKRRVLYQVGKALKPSTRNDGLILVSSVIAWLKTAKMPSYKEVHTDAIPVISTLPNVNQSGEIDETIASSYSSPDDEMNMIATTLEIMRENHEVSDEELRVALGLRTKEMAQLWRVKAISLLEREREVAEEAAE